MPCDSKTSLLLSLKLGAFFATASMLHWSQPLASANRVRFAHLGSRLLIELCCHAANVLYLLSYLVRDILWLRLLSCVGLIFGVIFFACQPTPYYGPSAWHVCFLVINGYQIRRLLRERRRQMLTAKQEKVAEAAFQELSLDELLNLLSHVMCKKPEGSPDIAAISRQALNKEEQVLRDLAFSRLSRGELLNLLTRRLWNSIIRLKPAGWSRSSQPRRIAWTPPGEAAAGK
jgi:hypothetical protein